MTNKRWGRVGDSPIIGAGTWADARCGVSGTGWGEFYIRAAVAHDICARVAYRGDALAAAADEVVDKIVPGAGRRRRRDRARPRRQHRDAVQHLAACIARGSSPTARAARRSIATKRRRSDRAAAPQPGRGQPQPRDDQYDHAALREPARPLAHERVDPQAPMKQASASANGRREQAPPRRVVSQVPGLEQHREVTVRNAIGAAMRMHAIPMSSFGPPGRCVSAKAVTSDRRATRRRTATGRDRCARPAAARGRIARPMSINANARPT